MKFALALLAVLATVNNLNAYTLPSIGSGELAKELQEFLDIVPVNEIMDLTKSYLTRDREFQIVLEVLHSDNIKQYVEDMEVMPDFSKLMNYLEDGGINAYLLLQVLKENLEMETAKVNKVPNCKITGGFYGFTQDLAEILPLQGISDMFEYKVMTSAVFNELVNKCLSSEYTNVFTSTFTNPNFLNALHNLDRLSIDSDLFRSNFSYLLVVETVLRLYNEQEELD